MRVKIVVSYVPRYRRGHSHDFVPPVTGIHLAAITPADHDVRVVHEQLGPATMDAPGEEPDLVALSFFSGFARAAYRTAAHYRERGIPVVAGGPHVSYWTEEALRHVDAVVTGEAEAVWPKVLADFAAGKLRRVYRGEPCSLETIPTARYDLLEKGFLVPRVLQATRGCPFACRFCTVPDLNPGFRVRPIADVVRDIATTHFPHWWQERVAWFWDDNLLVHRRWAKDLLREMRGLGRWWLTQASIDIVKDDELLDLMERSGCIGIFVGIESLDAEDIRVVGKKQNKVALYREAVDRLHDRGICVMAGFISGIDGQTKDSIPATAERLNALGVDVPFLSVLTPFRGTPLYDDMLREGRILTDRDWPHYNGYNVAFQPLGMTPAELLAAHRELWRRAFSPASVLERLARGRRQLRPGALLLSSTMNAFYGLKRLTRNLPADAPLEGKERVCHPAASNTPVRLAKLNAAAVEAFGRAASAGEA
jgi:radical SAM superfamily enzyme YgiQ (UPF0313 family)